MRMKNTALLTGPYDWDPELVPLAEFEARLAMYRQLKPLGEQTLNHQRYLFAGLLRELPGDFGSDVAAWGKMVRPRTCTRDNGPFRSRIDLW